MIDRGHVLSVTKQAEAAGIARSTVYYLPRPDPTHRLSAADRQAASGVPLRRGAGCCAVFWLPMGARPAAGGVQNADEADGDRGALPAPAHDEA